MKKLLIKSLFNVTAKFCLVVSFSLSAFLCQAQTYTDMLNFNGTNGSEPVTTLTLSGSKLYGTTFSGGANGFGNIFSINTNGTGYTDLWDFDDTGTNGANPRGAASLLGSVLVGLTENGGINGDGNIFSINTNGTGYKDLFDFGTGIAGVFPIGDLTISGTVMYGITAGGGQFGFGQIFSINTNGTNYQDLFDLNGINGGEPIAGTLAISGSVLYGMSSVGGAEDSGVMFSINTNGTNYAVLTSFNNTIGYNPVYKLIFADGDLYGVTENGGANGGGTLFDYEPGNGTFIDMVNFNGTNGSSPNGLTFSNNVLYGTSRFGGANEAGNIFSMNPDGSDFTVLYNFIDSTGANPFRILTISGNEMYGTAEDGGTTGNGVVFSFTPPCTFNVTIGSVVNVKCNGSSTGSAKGTPSGGATPYTYNWSNGTSTVSTSQTATDLSADNYTLNVTDNNGCTGTATVNITQAAPLTPPTPGSNSPVYAAEALDLTASTIAGATYSWTGPDGFTSSSQNPVISRARTPQAGTFSVTASVSGCTSVPATTNVQIDSSLGVITMCPSESFIEWNYGDPNGTFQWYISSGSGFTPVSNGPLFFGANTNDLVFTPPITKEDNDIVWLIETDGTTVFSSTAFTIKVDSITFNSSVITNVTCNGGSNGSATVSVKSGASPYIYSWAPVSGTNSELSGLSAGTYTVFVTDNNGCNGSTSVNITQVAAIVVNPSTIVNVSCNGGSNGSAIVEATGGSSPYTYSWSPLSGTNSKLSDLSAGTYTVNVTDKNGCTGTTSANITQPSNPLEITLSSQTNINCNIGTGSATANPATGGVSPYTYKWTPSGGANLTASNLAKGTYTLTVTDNHGCTATLTATISEPTSALAITISSHTNELCNGENTAGALANAATGGTPGVINTIAGNFAEGGGYSGNGGPATIAEINNPSNVKTDNSGNLYIADALNNVIRKVNSSGVITTFAGNGFGAGGRGGYSGDNGPATSAELNYPTDLAFDASGNLYIADDENQVIRKVNTAGIITTVAGNGFDVGDSGAYSGDGGQATAAELYFPNGVTFDGSGNLYIADAGNNRIRKVSTTGIITTLAGNGFGSNNNGNFSGDGGQATSAELNTPLAVAVDGSGNLYISDYYNTIIRKVNTSGIISTYAGIPFGLATVGYTGDGGPATSAELYGPVYMSFDGSGNLYFADWGNNVVREVNKNTNIITTVVGDGFGAGNFGSYSGDGGPATSAELNSPNGETFDASGNMYVADQYNNVIRKVSNYTYSWSPSGGTNSTASALSAGIYTITAKDANGCTATASVSITQPGMIRDSMIDANIVNISCNGGSTGSLTVGVKGGTLPYTYSWSPKSGTTSKLTGLSAGSYTANITDKNGCTSSTSITLTQTAAIRDSVTSLTGPTCNGGDNGIATIGVKGGTTPYTFAWSPSVSTIATATTLKAQPYTVTVKDKNNCSQAVIFTVTQPLAVSVSFSSNTGVHCSGGNTGNATANSATGGTSPYSYSWSPSGGTNLIASGLTAGTYTITAKDVNGCTGSASVSITQPGIIRDSVIAADIANISCNGGSNGSLTLGVKGGTAPYTYSWAPLSGSAAKLTGISAGTYTVHITDKNGCTSSSSLIFTQPAAIRDSVVSVISPTCNGGDNGIATIGVKGGTTPYTFIWTSSVSTTATATVLKAQAYTVTVKDKNNCSLAVIFTVTQPLAIRDSIIASSKVNISCNGESNGSATVGAKFGTTPYTFNWTPNGGPNASASGLSAGSYTIHITDKNGCTGTSSTSITQPTQLRDSISTVTCSGGNSDATLGVKGGTSPYTYLWMPGGGTNKTMNGLTIGTYTITVTDKNGCTATTSQSLNCSLAPPTGKGDQFHSDSSESGCCPTSDNINLYPNPNIGQFSISGLENGMIIEIYDYTGRKVETQCIVSLQTTMQFNLSTKSNGIYLVRILSKDGKLVSQKKVVKTL